VLLRCKTSANLVIQVTTALFLTGKITWHRAIQTIISQMLAGMAAAGFVSGLLPGPLIIATKLDPSISITRGLFLETFVTAQLVLTILMLKGGSAKPMYIGFSLFIAEICSVYFTGGSLNPARSFGPAVCVGFTSYHWIYWVGPLLGAFLASGAYALVRWVRQEPYSKTTTLDSISRRITTIGNSRKRDSGTLRRFHLQYHSFLARERSLRHFGSHWFSLHHCNALPTLLCVKRSETRIWIPRCGDQ
jgi:hypothetical protein